MTTANPSKPGYEQYFYSGRTFPLQRYMRPVRNGTTPKDTTPSASNESLDLPTSQDLQSLQRDLEQLATKVTRRIVQFESDLSDLRERFPAAQGANTSPQLQQSRSRQSSLSSTHERDPATPLPARSVGAIRKRSDASDRPDLTPSRPKKSEAGWSPASPTTSPGSFGYASRPSKANPKKKRKLDTPTHPSNAKDTDLRATSSHDDNHPATEHPSVGHKPRQSKQNASGRPAVSHKSVHAQSTPTRSALNTPTAGATMPPGDQSFIILPDEDEDTPFLPQPDVPTNSLLEALNPHKVNKDFSRTRVASEVSITTFWTSVDPYFRQITENDLKFLQEQGDMVTPFLTPTLGRHYTQVWAEEDREILAGLSAVHLNPAASATPAGLDSPFGYTPTRTKSRPSSRNARTDGKVVPAASGELTLPTVTPTDTHHIPSEGKPITEMLDEHLLDEQIGCGPLADRIVSALILDNLLDEADVAASSDDNATGTSHADLAANNGGTNGRATLAPIFSAEPKEAAMTRTSSLLPMGISPHVEIVGLEERLKRELRYIGILGEEDVDWANREDDQVSAVLRHAQRQLQEQCEINQKRKARLYDIAREHMAYQEYQHIVDELDKQVEQSYVKRNRGQKKKGKKTVAVKTALSDTA
ncbi:Transcriptional regulator, partial [Dimargaris verticillata]